MNRGLEDAAGWFVNGRLADAPFPLSPTLSLGEREHRSNSSRLRMRFMVPLRVKKRPACQRRESLTLYPSLHRMGRGKTRGSSLVSCRSI